MRTIRLVSLIVVVGLAALAASASGAREQRANVKVLADGLHVPWSIAFLPGGDALVSERASGWILRIPEQGGEPEARDAGSPGRRRRRRGRAARPGALAPLPQGPPRLRLPHDQEGQPRRPVQARRQVRKVFTGIRRNTYHDGGRIAFGPDNRLYVATGDAGNPPLAQKRGSLNGKILRLNPNGSIPNDNPFPDRRSGRSATATFRAWPGTGGPALGQRARPGHLRRGQPDPHGQQLRLAGGRGPRPDARAGVSQTRRRPGALGRLAERRGDPRGTLYIGGAAGRGRAAGAAEGQPRG